jgi:hypothetical protein
MGLPDGKPTTLRAVAAALRKQDDVNAALDALARVRPPHELQHATVLPLGAVLPFMHVVLPSLL